MADLKPKLTAVHDGQGRMAIYVDESVGQDAIVSHWAPRYQHIVVRGEPVTIFFDKNARSFYIGPVISKQEFMERPARYDYIGDLDWLPNARPAGAAGSARPAAPPGPAGPPESARPASPPGPAGSADPAASGGKTKKIPRPPTSWSVFMQDKLQQMRKENPDISFGAVSAEASRQWKAMSDEEKDHYQRVAGELADELDVTYANYPNKPARK